MSCNPKYLSIVLLASLVVSCGRDSRDLLAENTFTAGIEGPATDMDGNVYAVNFQEEGTIGRVSPEGKASLYLRLPEGSIGNGIQFDREGAMYIADYKRHRVYRQASPGAALEVLAENDLMNQPNDLCIHSNGSIYLSDPDWEGNSGNLWRVLPNGAVEKLEGGMGTTNGLTLSPDEKYLYVNESNQRKVWRYRLSESGDLLEKELFIAFKDFGLDGMRCDIKGNLYIARFAKGSLAVVNPEGKLIQEYFLKGKNPSNLTFGGPEGRSCYITMADRGCFEIVETPYPGALFKTKY